MQAFFDRLGENLHSTDWWADNVLNFAIFVGVVAVLGWMLSASAEARRRARYKGWRLSIVGFGDREQTLHWQEVERFQNSRFELWKFAKSVVSGTERVNLRTADPAIEAGWLKVDERNRRILIDFTRIPDGHRTASRSVHTANPV